MSVPIKLVTVIATGKRFIFINDVDGKVHVQGPVLRIAGFDAVHGPVKAFLKPKVKIEECEMSLALLGELLNESGAMTEGTVVKPPKREKWVDHPFKNNPTMCRITPHGRKMLEKEGYDWGLAEIGNTLPFHGSLEDAATEMAYHHAELTRDGIPEGHYAVREAAADFLFSGLCRAREALAKDGSSIRLGK